MNENLKVWNSFNQPPQTALKTIAAGRMKGKSDINPQWRYKAMTETFGIAGIGWKFTIDKLWTEAGANNEVMAFANVSVYVKADGQWSDAIQGNGGSTLIAKESSGMHNSDEAFKMAITDALSTALKMLGVAADIYMGMWDGTKYSQPNQAEQTDAERKAKAMSAFDELKKRAAKVGVTIKEPAANLTPEQMLTHYREQVIPVKSAEAIIAGATKEQK